MRFANSKKLTATLGHCPGINLPCDLPFNQVYFQAVPYDSSGKTWPCQGLEILSNFCLIRI
jgi:hypothetical protein